MFFQLLLIVSVIAFQTLNFMQFHLCQTQSLGPKLIAYFILVLGYEIILTLN
jgi:hypothetical protein